MGVSIIWKLGSPAAEVLSGIHVDQHDMPWWMVRILGWLAMVRAIQDSHLAAWRSQIRHMLEKEPPTAIYALYQDYVQAMDRED